MFMVSDLIGFPDLNDQGRQVGEGEGSHAPIGRPFYVSDCLSRVSNWSSLSYHRLSFTQKQPSHTQQLKGAFKKRDKKALGSKGWKKSEMRESGETGRQQRGAIETTPLRLPLSHLYRIKMQRSQST